MDRLFVIGYWHALHDRDARGPGRRYAAPGVAIPRCAERGWRALSALVREARRVVPMLPSACHGEVVVGFSWKLGVVEVINAVALHSVE